MPPVAPSSTPFSNLPDATLFAALIAAAFAVLFLAWLYYEIRESRRNDWRTRSSTFCCLKCRHLYSIVRRPKTAPCPKCNFTNSRLHF